MQLRNLGLSALAFALMLVAGMIFTPSPSSNAEPSARTKATSIERNIRVIDGDTIEDMTSDITYRLVNIDTPETGSRARCPAERELRVRASREGRSLMRSAGDIELRPTGRVDRYGRTIALVLIDGRDLGETLIAEGLARPWRGRREPWCDAGGNLLP